MTAGKPSGIAATAKATAILKQQIAPWNEKLRELKIYKSQDIRDFTDCSGKEYKQFYRDLKKNVEGFIYFTRYFILYMQECIAQVLFYLKWLKLVYFW